MATQRCFLYRRLCDNMLMIHDPVIKPVSCPDFDYYEFNDEHIADVATYEQINTGATKFPRHLGVFVRKHIEKNTTEDVLKIIKEDDYEAADQLIISALQSYVQLPLKERIKLHMKELDKIRKQLRQESRIRLS
jgi:transposase-like protein